MSATMTPEDYNRMLSCLSKDEDWEKVPFGDRILYWQFGSISPRLLRRPHRLVRPDVSLFTRVLSALDSKAGVLGVYPPSSEGENYIPDLSPEDLISLWAEEFNQDSLIAGIGKYKHVGGLTIICNAELPKAIVRKLSISAAYKLACLGENVSVSSAFDDLEALIDECGWFFIPLNEYTAYDLWVFGKKHADKGVGVIDQECTVTAVRWKNGRAYWPDEPGDHGTKPI